MSKSTGNVVNPFFALDRFGVDAIRYYMAHDGGIKDDADYENAYITKRYKKDLHGGIGNLTSRITRSKVWNVRRAVQRAPEGLTLDKRIGSSNQLDRLKHLRENVTAQFDKLDSGAALKLLIRSIYHVSSETSNLE